MEGLSSAIDWHRWYFRKAKMDGVNYKKQVPVQDLEYKWALAAYVVGV